MKPTKLFLDLDGVLVDFESGVFNILKKNQGINSNVDYMLEFFGKEGLSKSSVAKLLSNRDLKETLRELIIKDPTWWASLGWMPDGKELWEYIKQHNPIILSSDMGKTNSTEGKLEWVRKNLGPDVKAIITDHKGEYAEPNSMLVDDRQFVLDEFIAAGGEGLLHVNSKDTIANLERIYSANESLRYIKSYKNWLNE